MVCSVARLDGFGTVLLIHVYVQIILGSVGTVWIIADPSVYHMQVFSLYLVHLFC